MSYDYFDLPTLPPSICKLRALCDSRDIPGYSRHQLMAYALDAVEDYKRKSSWTWRLRRWLREVLA